MATPHDDAIRGAAAAHVLASVQGARLSAREINDPDLSRALESTARLAALIVRHYQINERRRRHGIAPVPLSRYASRRAAATAGRISGPEPDRGRR